MSNVFEGGSAMNRKYPRHWPTLPARLPAESAWWHAKTRMACVLCLSVVATDLPATEAYKCVDGAGNLTFSDKPCGDKHEKIQLKNPNLVTTPSSEEGIRFQLMHAGEPIKMLTTVAPTFSIWDESRKNPKYGTRYHPGENTYSFSGLAEGQYSVNISIDANRGNPGNYPGDFRGSFRYPVMNGLNTIIPVHMEKLIHLVKPQDNQFPLAPWGSSCNQVLTITPKTVLEWESLGPNVHYTFDVRRTVCEPFSWKESVLNQRVMDNRVALDLPVNKPGEMYTLTLKAHTTGGLPVGTLMTHGLNGYSWDYRFRIVSSGGSKAMPASGNPK